MLFMACRLDKPTIRYLPSTQHQTDTVSNWVVNMAEHVLLETKNRGIRTKDIGLNNLIITWDNFRDNSINVLEGPSQSPNKDLIEHL